MTPEMHGSATNAIATSSHDSTNDHSSTIQILLEWCTNNNVILDYRLELVSDTNNSISVWATAPIPFGTTVAYINKDAVLSIKSCSFSELISPVPWGIGAQLALAFALYGEILKAQASTWWGYLQSLPVGVNLPIFWGSDAGDEELDESITDRRAGLEWIYRTQAQRIIQGSSDHPNGILGEINEFYESTVKPMILNNSLHFNNSTPTLHGFHRAYSLVSSRAFIVDAYHGLSMVPIADAFNHQLGNHVHLESDYAVCPLCGSLRECIHDYTGGTGLRSGRQHLLTTIGHGAGAHISDASPVHGGTLAYITTAMSSDYMGNKHRIGKEKNEQSTITIEIDSDSFYEMVASNSVTILPNTEAFNTYGETLTNAQLLARYGFILEENANDYVSWEVRDIWMLYCRQCRELGHATRRPEPGFSYNNIVAVWGQLLQSETVQDTYNAFDAFKYSDLVYCHFATDRDGNDAGHPSKAAIHPEAPPLCVNVDGRISHQLWLLLILLALDEQGLIPIELRNESGEGEGSEGCHDREEAEYSADEHMRTSPRRSPSFLLPSQLVTAVWSKVKEMVVQQLYFEALSRNGGGEDQSGDEGAIDGEGGSTENMTQDELEGARDHLPNTIALVDYDSEEDNDVHQAGMQCDTQTPPPLSRKQGDGDPSDWTGERSFVCATSGSWNESSGKGQREPAKTSLKILSQIGQTIMNVCHHQRRAIAEDIGTGDEDQYVGGVNDLRNGLEGHMWRTRMVLSLMISELSLLENCERAWGNFVLSVENDRGKRTYD